MIISPCKSGRIDPVVYNIIKDIDTSLTLVPVTRLEDFVFNDELKSHKDVVIVDFVEYGWDWDMKETHIFGRNTEKFNRLFNTDEWRKFDEWVEGIFPRLYLKRELLKKDVSPTVKPLQYPAWHKPPEPDSKEKYLSRPLEYFQAWGLSHEGRKRVHGDIWMRAGKHNYIVCDNIDNLSSFLQYESNPRKWLTQNTPYYRRYEMSTINEVNGMTKLSGSWAGAGRCCFRMTECSINSLMVMWEDQIEYSYSWIDGFNCIRVEEGNEVEGINFALQRNNLYELYLNGVETANKYYYPTYINNYLMPILNNI